MEPKRVAEENVPEPEVSLDALFEDSPDEANGPEESKEEVEADIV